MLGTLEARPHLAGRDARGRGGCTGMGEGSEGLCSFLSVLFLFGSNVLWGVNGEGGNGTVCGFLDQMLICFRKEVEVEICRDEWHWLILRTI